jgi:hypothetical protein
MKFSASRKKQRKTGIQRFLQARLRPFSKKLTKCRLSGAGIFFDFQGRSNDKY